MNRYEIIVKIKRERKCTISPALWTFVERAGKKKKVKS